MDFQSFLDEFALKSGKTLKKVDSGYSAHCPSHDDSNPSLSIAEASDGKILLHCHAGCSVNNICSALGIRTSELFVSNVRAERRETIYSYKDEKGIELYRKVRVEPGKDVRSKDFRLERVDEEGSIVYKIKGCRRVLYRLPELLQAIAENKPVYLVEGEKDADKLWRHNLPATTALDSSYWPNEFTEFLTNADVILLYDMDKAGIVRKDKLCAALYKKVKRLRVIDLPGLEYQESHGKDISDWLAEGHTTQELQKLVESAQDYSPALAKSKVRAVTLKEFLQMQLPEREMLLFPFLLSQGLCLLYAKRGVGKTHIALGIAYAVATGGKFLKWTAPHPKKVLYIDGEMSALAMQERLRRISVMEDVQPPDPSYLRLITPDLQEEAMPDLATKEGRAALEPFLADCDLVIFDNVSTLFRTGVENEAESWQPIQDWALELRRKGKSVLFIHHAGKGGQQRGTSKKEDILDAVLLLRHPSGYTSDQGLIFEVVFEKNRHFTGDDAETFRVNVKEQDDGLWKWIIEAPTVDLDMQKVVTFKKEGFSIREIAERTGLSKSQVETKLKNAKDQKLIE